MRIVGFILVVLGALALGWQGFTVITTERIGEGANEVRREKQNTVWIPPLVGAIVVVSGLLLLANGDRRDEA